MRSQNSYPPGAMGRGPWTWTLLTHTHSCRLPLRKRVDEYSSHRCGEEQSPTLMWPFPLKMVIKSGLTSPSPPSLSHQPPQVTTETVQVSVTEEAGLGPWTLMPHLWDCCSLDRHFPGQYIRWIRKSPQRDPALRKPFRGARMPVCTGAVSTAVVVLPRAQHQSSTSGQHKEAVSRDMLIPKK